MKKNITMMLCAMALSTVFVGAPELAYAAGPAGIVNPMFVQNGIGAVPRTFREKAADTINIRDFGAAPGASSTRNYNAFNRAMAAIAASSVPGKIYMPAGIYKMSGKITINPMSAQIVGDGGVTLDFSEMVTGTAISVQGTPTAGESISRNRMRTSGGFTIKGAPAMTLMDVSSGAGVDSAAITFRDIVFDTGAVGLALGTNGWQFTLDGYSFTNIAVHIKEAQDSAPSVTNFGERNLFMNGIHSGAGLAYMSRNYNSDAHFVGVSFDSARFVDIARGARVFITNSHMETAADTGFLFLVDGDPGGFTQTKLTVRDSVLVLPGNSRTFPVFGNALNYPVGNGGIDIDGLAISCEANYTMPSNSLVSGEGLVRARNINGPYQFPAITLAPSLNQVKEGGFEVTNFDLTDMAAVAEEFPPVIDSTVKYSGENSLKMASIGTAFVGASITKAVRPGQKVLFDLQYKMAAVANGAFFIIKTQVLDKKGNVILINDQATMSGTADWTRYSNTNLRINVMPKGADRLYVSAQLNSGNGTGTAWIDEVKINIID